MRKKSTQPKIKFPTPLLLIFVALILGLMVANRPEKITESPNYDLPVPTATPGLSTAVLAENEDYRIEVEDPDGFTEDLNDINGKVTVIDKINSSRIQISNEINLRFSARIIKQIPKPYLILHESSYILGKNHPISLDKKVLLESFCSLNVPLFWTEDLVVYSTCDSIDNREAGGWEAPSIFVRNLLTGDEKIILEANLMEDFAVRSITGDTLTYHRSWVENDNDWKDQDKINSATETLNLTNYY